ncbi:hypothetical protein ACLM45_08205 [Synechococcus sp. A10-1-5-9]|uniref:hypothetical protein n=1 Tax=Synechococcus sp. A10-1-5-9 TaxID=3392295 RepID=UPI0039EBB5F9
MAAILNDRLLLFTPGTGSTALEVYLKVHAHIFIPNFTFVPDDRLQRHIALADVETLLNRKFDVCISSTRNPVNYYFSEWYRMRTKWAKELDKPDSWIHQSRTKEFTLKAMEMNFEDWIIDHFSDLSIDKQLHVGPHYKGSTKFLRCENLCEDFRSALSEIYNKPLELFPILRIVNSSNIPPSLYHSECSAAALEAIIPRFLDYNTACGYSNTVSDYL